MTPRNRVLSRQLVFTMEVNSTEKSMSNPNQEDNQNKQQQQGGQQHQGGQQGGQNNPAKVASSRAGRTSPVTNIGE